MIGERASAARAVAPVHTTATRFGSATRTVDLERTGSRRTRQRGNPNEPGAAGSPNRMYGPPRFCKVILAGLNVGASANLKGEANAGVRDRTNPAGRESKKECARSSGADQPARDACQRTCGGVASRHGLDRLQHSGPARATTTLTRRGACAPHKQSRACRPPVGARRPPEPWPEPFDSRAPRSARCVTRRGRTGMRPRRGLLFVPTADLVRNPPCL
jgi:hypothetical protein